MTSTYRIRRLAMPEAREAASALADIPDSARTPDCAMSATTVFYRALA